MRSGVPAIVVSVGVPWEELSAQIQRFPSTHAAFEPAASFNVTLIDRLQSDAQNDDLLLPAGTLLNVNYPALSSDQITGVRLTQLGQNSLYQVTNAEPDTSSELISDFSIHDEANTELDEKTWFTRGYLTISVSTGIWTAEKSEENALSSRLSGLVESSMQ